MSHTIQLTAEQFEALQSGQPITIEPPKPTVIKRQPIGGNYPISFSSNLNKEGFAYSTSQADSEVKQLRAYARQLAWLAENDDGWVANWSDNKQLKFYVYYYHGSETYEVYHSTTVQIIGLIHMSEENATKLAQLMKNGLVEF